MPELEYSDLAREIRDWVNEHGPLPQFYTLTHVQEAAQRQESDPFCACNQCERIRWLYNDIMRRTYLTGAWLDDRHPQEETRNCLACGDPQPTYALCDDCGYCTQGCCECRRCQNCNRNLENQGRCEDDEDTCSRCCCSYHTRSGVEFRTREVMFHPAQPGRQFLNPSTRMVAVEIEVDHYNGNATQLNRSLRQWNCSVVTDGSLDGENSFEINTAPAGGDRFVQEIVDLCSGLDIMRARVNHHCGLHIHIDARDYDHYAMRKLIRLYSLLEPTFFALVPGSRRRNNYCMPCGALLQRNLKKAKLSSENTRQVEMNVYQLDGYDEAQIQDRKRQKYDSSRYNALNVHSWYYRGTVECRLHAGSTRAERIIGWGILWACFLDHCKAIRDNDILKLERKYLGQLNPLRRPVDRYIVNDPETSTAMPIEDGIKYLATKVAPNRTVASYIKARYRSLNRRNF